MNKSAHILNTSSNLLGFSFLVLVSIKGLGLPQGGLVDEMVAVQIIIFAMSSILSFVSIRIGNQLRSAKYETYADFVFLAGLIFTLVLCILLAVNVVLFTK